MSDIPAGPTRPGPSAADRAPLPLRIHVERMKEQLATVRSEMNALSKAAKLDDAGFCAAEGISLALDSIEAVILELCRGKII